MSAPLLYHVLHNLLVKGEPVDANFILHRYGSTPCSGVVRQVKLNNDGSMVIYVMDGSEIQFRTMDERDAERLHLRRTDSDAWVLENAPPLAPSEDLEEERSTEYDLEVPLLVHLTQQLMDKGEHIDLHWDAPMEFASGKIQHIVWDARHGISIYFDDTTTGDTLASDVTIKPNDVDDFELTKGGKGWLLAKRDT